MCRTNTWVATAHDHGEAEPQGADRSQAGNEQSDGANDFHDASHDAEPLSESDLVEQLDHERDAGQFAEPAARNAAARIPCNVQAPIRRVGRTCWIEAALILDSMGVRLKLSGGAVHLTRPLQARDSPYNRARCRQRSWRDPLRSSARRSSTAQRNPDWQGPSGRRLPDRPTPKPRQHRLDRVDGWAEFTISDCFHSERMSPSSRSSPQ